MLGFKRTHSLQISALSLVLFSLNACISLGQKTLPETPKSPQFTLTACASENTALAFQGKQLSLQILSTAKTPWNTHLRYVYPYTQNTVQFEVSVTNPSRSSEVNKNTVTLAEEVILQLKENSTPTKSLPFTYWEKVWPASAARNSQELHDRSMAMGEIIKQRWQTRILYPGETYTALAVFPSSVLTQQPQKLIISYQSHAKEETIALCLTPPE